MRIYDLEPLECKAMQLKHGDKKFIDEIISREEAFQIEYNCTYEGQEYSGKKELYAYPFQGPYLAVGHVINDCLPFSQAHFQVEVREKNHEILLKMCAQPQEIVKPIVYEPFALTHIIHSMSTFLKQPGNWDGTGCFHRAGLFHPINQQFIIAEDIGRHNCIDRLVGYAVMNNLSISHYFLFITARVTASLFHKARRAGFHTIISRSAITSEAYLGAKAENVSLAGFCRPEESRVTVFNDKMNSFI